MTALYHGASVKYIVVALFFISFSFNLFAQEPAWYSQNSGTSKWLEGVHFTDHSNGWAVGWDGTILHTANGGLHWEEQESGTTRDLYSVYFIDSLTGWAVGYRTMLHTINGGNEWMAQTTNLPFGTTIRDVHFINPLVGWAVGHNGEDGHAIRTTDGGQTWVNASTNPAHPVFSVYYVDELTGYAAGGLLTSGRIYKTTDGGENFYSSGTTNWRLWDIHFSDENNGRAVGHNGVTRFTIDGGETWSNSSIGSMELFSVFMLNDSTAWVSGGAGTMRHYNGSLPWVTQSSGTGAQLHSVCFVDEQTGWAVGSNGTIIHYTTDGESWTYVAENEGAATNSAIYPIPFSDRAILEIELDTPMPLSVDVFDLSGNIVQSIYHGSIGMGKHTMYIHGHELNSGVYFVRIETDRGVDMIRIVHVK